MFKNRLIFLLLFLKDKFIEKDDLDLLTNNYLHSK